MIIENITIIKKAICNYNIFINIIWIFLTSILIFQCNRRRYIWQQDNNTKESKVTETVKESGKGVG